MQLLSTRSTCLVACLVLAIGSLSACSPDGNEATASDVDETTATAVTEAAEQDTDGTDAPAVDAATDIEPEATQPPDESTAGLTEDEISALMWMRGEEQLAHDVYLAFDEMWGLRIFENITASEERHVAAVHDLLDDFGLDDPSATLAPGTFDDPDIQALYDDLVARGSNSELDALAVGALIEELDIADLREFAAATDDASIVEVYGALERGSRNHLRAFVSQIEARDGTYEPTVLDDALDIVDSPSERGDHAGGDHANGGMGRGRHRHGGA